ncbi:hypothetical protein MBLNU459_g5187t1 [Dothideomycetes sp. NU459]
MAQPTAQLGPLVRIKPLIATKLPVHPDLGALQPSPEQCPTLEAFIISVLEEASTFMTGYLPVSFVVKSASKQSAPSAAAVQLLAHDVPQSALPKESRSGVVESWFARTSLHEDKAEQGTASWDEFESGLLDNHGQHEMEYTPDVFDAYKVLSWDEQLAALDGKIGKWEKVGLSIYEMCHHIPPPLNNRVFSVVVVTARSVSAEHPSFLVVQIPVDISKVPQSMYSNGKNKESGDTAQKKKPVVVGQYVSIERCEKKEAHVEWQMATASDAKGNLPMWMQKMGVPGAIIKDVGLFIDWTSNNRRST